MNKSNLESDVASGWVLKKANSLFTTNSDKDHGNFSHSLSLTVTYGHGYRKKELRRDVAGM